uniref:Uncharacterized protein n=1 Tax=Stegastes partitus TaxID=144197 RepID=A0A3B4ZU32_9TELE
NLEACARLTLPLPPLSPFLSVTSGTSPPAQKDTKRRRRNCTVRQGTPADFSNMLYQLLEHMTLMGGVSLWKATPKSFLCCHPEACAT